MTLCLSSRPLANQNARGIAAVRRGGAEPHFPEHSDLRVPEQEGPVRADDKGGETPFALLPRLQGEAIETMQQYRWSWQWYNRNNHDEKIHDQHYNPDDNNWLLDCLEPWTSCSWTRTCWSGNCEGGETLLVLLRRSQGEMIGIVTIAIMLLMISAASQTQSPPKTSNRLACSSVLYWTCRCNGCPLSMFSPLTQTKHFSSRRAYAVKCRCYRCPLLLFSLSTRSIHLLRWYAEQYRSW